MILMSLIGGLVGFALGEWLLNEYIGRWPMMVLVGAYFGILALFVGLFCLIAEQISPRLNGASWRQRYVSTSWKLLVPATLIMLFVGGTAMEFIYELNVNGSKKVSNIVLLIDDSGSMGQNDPKQARYSAAKNLVDQMDTDKRVAVLTFNDHAQIVQPFIRLDSNSSKNQVRTAIDQLKPTDGGTDLDVALADTLKHIKDQATSNRGTMVILLSDGVSQLNMQNALKEYIQDQIAVNTIGLNLVDVSGSNLLKDVAQATGGSYSDVSDAGNLSLAFQRIYDTLGDRSLITERTGSEADNMYYTLLRVAGLIFIGLLLGLALGIMFDNRYLAKSFAIGGAVSGLLAGLILEFGLRGSVNDPWVWRLLADLILAGVITLFSSVIPVKEHYKSESQRGNPAARGAAAGYVDRSNTSHNKSF
ncbi:vWA domain-containing protein [Paenibacillus shirakamiensis]|nr:vWA domain-containing protein [Paenibacillus shirakamiensis]